MYVCVWPFTYSIYKTLSFFRHISVSPYSTVALLLPVSYPVAERPVSSGSTLLRKYSLRDASCVPQLPFHPTLHKSRHNVY